MTDVDMTGLSDKDERAMMLALILGTAIKGIGVVPSGELYARIMDKVSLHEYNDAIAVLVHGKVIASQNHLLIWIGPKGGN